jgi:hypothetical protein
MRCRELHADTQPSAHLAGFKDRVRVKFTDGGECTGGVVAGMKVTEIEEDGLEFRAGVILKFQKPDPHVIGAVIDHEHAIA